MERRAFGMPSKVLVAVALVLIALLAIMTSAMGTEVVGPTQVITVYFAGTLLKSDTEFSFGKHPHGDRTTPELLQYLYHEQDVSDPNQHKIWVDGIGNRDKGPLDAGLAARNANRCAIDGSSHPDPWDPNRTTLKFNSAYGVHLAGFECWDYRLHEALDTNKTTDLFHIMDANRNSPVILNVLGHSRGGILAMMLAHKVSQLQRRYEKDGELFPEHTKFKAINIISFDAVPGNPGEIGLHDVETRKFKGSFEYFVLSPLVSNYVGFYAKDERQNIFQAVIPDHTPKTRVWHLALNGAHQTMVGNPRTDGHEYEPAFLPGAGSEAFGPGFDSNYDLWAISVASVTNIITRELLKSPGWGNVKFTKSWRSRQGAHYSAGDCEGDEGACMLYFMDQYRKQEDMPKTTKVKMRSVAHPGYSALLIPEGGLQAWTIGSRFGGGSRVGGKQKSGCNARVQWHHGGKYGYKSYGSGPDYFAGDEFGKCTWRAFAHADGTRLNPVSLIHRRPDRSESSIGSGITDISANMVCNKLVEFTGLPWTCRR